MTVDKTYVPKGIVEGNWLLVDANEKSLGRLTTQIVKYLLGKHKPDYTPGVDMGDYVVVVNAERVHLSATRLEEKVYYHHSNFPGGLKAVSLRTQLRTRPERIIRAAVWGMLPHNKLGRQLIKKLKVYAGNEHPHVAQSPKPVA